MPRRTARWSEYRSRSRCRGQKCHPQWNRSKKPAGRRCHRDIRNPSRGRSRGRRWKVLPPAPASRCSWRWQCRQKRCRRQQGWCQARRSLAWLQQKTWSLEPAQQEACWWQARVCDALRGQSVAQKREQAARPEPLRQQWHNPGCWKVPLILDRKERRRRRAPGFPPAGTGSLWRIRWRQTWWWHWRRVELPSPIKPTTTLGVSELCGFRWASNPQSAERPYQQKRLWVWNRHGSCPNRSGGDRVGEGTKG